MSQISCRISVVRLSGVTGKIDRVRFWIIKFASKLYIVSYECNGLENLMVSLTEHATFMALHISRETIKDMTDQLIAMRIVPHELASGLLVLGYEENGLDISQTYDTVLPHGAVFICLKAPNDLTIDVELTYIHTTVGSKTYYINVNL